MNTQPQVGYTSRVMDCVRTSVPKGTRSAVEILLIIIPISFAVVLLKWFGVLALIAKWAGPAFRLAGLPGEASLAFLTGAFVNLYSVFGVMSAMGLTARQVTILGVMCLISHNLPVEVAIQHKTGTSGARMLGLRLLTSAASGVALNLIMPAGAEMAARKGSAVAGPFSDELRKWALDTGWLSVKVLLIIIGLMILLRLMTEFGVIEWMVKPLRPLLWLLGLPRKTAFLWLVANTLGLAYGGGIIIEEVRTGELNRREVDLLNHSVAICHSLLEDTLLFVAVGAWVFWLVMPRLVLAAAATWLHRLTWRRDDSTPATE